MNTPYDLIIIGYGAAGMMAAAEAKGLKTLVIEKNSSAGRKVMISGKGQCNFTHEEALNEFVGHFGDHKNFVKHALGKLTPQMTRDCFKSRGIDSVVMENGKVFPKSLQAGDLIEVLVNEALNNGVEIRYKEAVEGINHLMNEKLFEVKTAEAVYVTKNMLLATGGFTYAVTGSDGDGYKWAKALGHTIESPRPALTPIYHSVELLKALAGVSIPEANVALCRGGKTLSHYTGDLLFTHKGLSGPVILNNSRSFMAGDLLKIALTPMSPEYLTTDMAKMVEKHGKTTLRAYLRQHCYSKSIGDQLSEALEIPEKETFAQMNKVLRQKIVMFLTQFEVPIDQIGGRQIAMVTAGGVALEEIKGKNMASKIAEGLYFAGEVVDVDGDTGGYNIQWAFSSAVLAVNDIKAKRY